MGRARTAIRLEVDEKYIRHLRVKTRREGQPWQTYKAIVLTGDGGPYSCETSRLPHFRDNRLKNGGDVVSLMRRPSFTPKKIPGTLFC
jgi:hypothetical protein